MKRQTIMQPDKATGRTSLGAWPCREVMRAFGKVQNKRQIVCCWHSAGTGNCMCDNSEVSRGHSSVIGRKPDARRAEHKLKVKANKGAPGIDGLCIEDFPAWLREHGSDIRQALYEGSYQPQAVQRVSLPKPGGGERLLGIPTVMDRVIQQAIAQVLTPLFDPDFSPSSFGFRPGRSAHDALRQAAIERLI